MYLGRGALHMLNKTFHVWEHACSCVSLCVRDNATNQGRVGGVRACLGHRIYVSIGVLLPFVITAHQAGSLKWTTRQHLCSQGSLSQGSYTFASRTHLSTFSPIHVRSRHVRPRDQDEAMRRRGPTGTHIVVSTSNFDDSWDPEISTVGTKPVKAW